MDTDRLLTDALQILSTGGTPLCTIWTETKTDRLLRTLRLHEGRASNSEDVEHHTIVFCVGSLSKPLMAAAIIITIKKLVKSADPTNQTLQNLQNAWEIGICKSLCGSSLHDGNMPEPTLEELLLHICGPPSMNDLILGPDGTVLISREDFLSVAQHVSKEVHTRTGKNRAEWEYNNGGYILCGLFIEKYFGLSPGEFLKQVLFEPLGMNHSYATIEDFERIPGHKKAAAHVVSTSGYAQRITEAAYFDNTVALIAMGVFSCMEDLAIFFRALLGAYSGVKEESYIDHSTACRLLVKQQYISGHPSGYYSLCGMWTKLDSSTPGSQSLNRTVAPSESDSSSYRLGLNSEGRSVHAVYHSGSVTGYEGCFYLMPDEEAFVIVLSNATSLVDVSDHISRLVLQELYGLRRSPLNQMRLYMKHLFKHGRARMHYFHEKVDIVERARSGADERRRYLESYGCHLNHDMSPKLIQTGLSLIGRYDSRDCRQTIFIELGNCNCLVIWFKGSRGFSSKMNLVLVSDQVALICPFLDNHSVLSGIDIFGDWSDLELTLESNVSREVMALTRKRECFSVRYERQPTA
jgi:CubicO group peptidase (beta-lactamase class C family)